ncbi:MAG: hypothetical protein CM15mP2_0600 [Methanobacteriota archaeon]|nr:MAG: hypothetical protein CM15mP2_0600 [Euryarchaeota archaeon]
MGIHEFDRSKLTSTLKSITFANDGIGPDDGGAGDHYNYDQKFLGKNATGGAVGVSSIVGLPTAFGKKGES